MIQSIAYHAEQAGPRLLVLGAVHGNEKCGTAAIRRVCASLDSGQLTLTRGRVTYVPVCNPGAYAADTRFVERNLNRYLVPMAAPDCYEARLGNALCPLLADCDMLLDIHSYTIGGAPFVIVDAEAEAAERAFAACLGAAVTLSGWAQAYAATGKKKAQADENESVGTIQWARRHGAMGATIECGQHKDPTAEPIAYHAIHNALRHLGLVAETRQDQRDITPRRITMTQVYYHDDAGSFPQPWANFDAVKAGEVMGVRANGEVLRAPQDGVIIMPRPGFAPGEEWFYFGVEAAR